MDGTDREKDRHEITRVVTDYYESWFEGDPERMARSVHPNLAKRAPLAALVSFGAGQGGDPDSLDEDTRETMVEATERGMGKTRAVSIEDRAIEIEIDDVYDWIASVRVRSPVYHEYLHLLRTSAGWKIVNALWQRTSGSSPGS